MLTGPAPAQADGLTTLVADQHIRVITDNGELLRELTIDPNRNNQSRRT
jgi:hypothetical protein